MPRFEFTWKTGEVEVEEGNSVSDAFMRLGYGGGAMGALDKWRVIEDEEGS